MLLKSSAESIWTDENRFLCINRLRICESQMLRPFNDLTVILTWLHELDVFFFQFYKVLDTFWAVWEQTNSSETISTFFSVKFSCFSIFCKHSAWFNALLFLFNYCTLSNVLTWLAATVRHSWGIHSALHPSHYICFSYLQFIIDFLEFIFSPPVCKPRCWTQTLRDLKISQAGGKQLGPYKRAAWWRKEETVLTAALWSHRGDKQLLPRKQHPIMFNVIFSVAGMFCVCVSVCVR